MTQIVYYQRVKVNACCFVTSSLPGIYKSLTAYCIIMLQIKKPINSKLRDTSKMQITLLRINPTFKILIIRTLTIEGHYAVLSCHFFQ
jgi:hypothetical protein